MRDFAPQVSVLSELMLTFGEMTSNMEAHMEDVTVYDMAEDTLCVRFKEQDELVYLGPLVVSVMEETLLNSTSEGLFDRSISTMTLLSMLVYLSMILPEVSLSKDVSWIYGLRHLSKRHGIRWAITKK
jgi:hypothetical protein